MRLQLATQIVVSIGVVILAEWIFVRVTGAIQVPIPPKTPAAMASELWLVNHALMVIAMMLGAILAMISGFGVSMYANARSQLITMLVLPLPLLATLAMGLSLHVRMLSLASMPVVLAIGTYCRRFGPIGFNGGVLAFMGAFLGFFIQDYVPLHDFGWLAAEVGVGTAVTIAVHLLLFYPRPAAAVRRTQRSYAARTRDVAADTAELYQFILRFPGHHAAQRAERKLHRQLLRLNEAALLIDARLDTPSALPAGWSAAALHQLLFNAEAGLSNAARFALTIARRPLPAEAIALVGRSLEGIRDADFDAVMDSAAAMRELLEPGRADLSWETATDRVLLHRFATCVTEFSVAIRGFRRYPDCPPDPVLAGTALSTPWPAGTLPADALRSDALPPDSLPPDALPAGAGPAGAVVTDAAPTGTFESQVWTFGGWLPGASGVAQTASEERGGPGLIERIRLAPYARIAIQMLIATSGAIALGDQLSGRRYYWALLAAFITFMGAHTAGEQLRKSTFRVAGTLVGVFVGALLAHLVGDRVAWQIVVVLVALFLGLYLFRVNYTFMTIGITVMVSQLYVEMDEFSNSLLLLRLEETALGAGVAMLTVLLVMPLRVGRVARVAAREQIAALADLADRCLDRLADPGSRAGSDLELRAAARRSDMAYQALMATVRPMRTPLFGRLASRVAGFTATAVAARHYAANLLLDASTRYADLTPRAAAELAQARAQLAASAAAVTAALAPAAGLEPDGREPGRRSAGKCRPGTYIRSASLFAHIADGLPGDEFTSRPQLALRDLQLLDSAFANAARWAGVPVTDLDTTAPAGPDAPGGPGAAGAPGGPGAPGAPGTPVA
jgi:uncharacterized membrane protein YgaE (UPF0421/DUF939 family)